MSVGADAATDFAQAMISGRYSKCIVSRQFLTRHGSDNRVKVRPARAQIHTDDWHRWQTDEVRGIITSIIRVNEFPRVHRDVDGDWVLLRLRPVPSDSLVQISL